MPRCRLLSRTNLGAQFDDALTLWTTGRRMGVLSMEAVVQHAVGR